MDSEKNKTLWNLKYRQGLPSLAKPDPFFVSAYGKFVDRSFPTAGTALDLAGGLGRHALWLATRKWQVSVVDISEVAIGQLNEAARELGVKLNLLAVDLAEYNFEPARFDLIVLFYHLDRNLFPKIISALNPGGLFVCKMHVRWDSEGGLAKIDANPLDRDELVSLVRELHVLYHHERPVRARGVVEFVGKKLNLL